MSDIENLQLTSLVRCRRHLMHFGHVARVLLHEDHHRASAVAVQKLPTDWKRSCGWPANTWLGTVDANVKPVWGTCSVA